MRRYHQEKQLMETRLMRARELMLFPEHVAAVPGRYRKSLRKAGCGRGRCQLCHSEKYPKRQLTRKEEQILRDLKNQTED